jgi:hypothetical protein
VLAYTVDAAVKIRTASLCSDFASGRVVALENDAKLYTRLAWNDKGTALAVLKGPRRGQAARAPERARRLCQRRASIDGQGPASQPVMLDPARAAGFPKEMVLSDRAAVSWSDDSTRVYFGVKAQVPVPDATRADRDTKADVDVWNAIDERIQSLQMNRADADRNFTYRSAMVVSTGPFVKLADPTMKDIDIALTGKWAVGRDQRGQIKIGARRPPTTTA